MTSLLDKARVAVLANLHELLDRAVDTPEGYKQYIRDLESGMADMRAAHDEAVGTLNGYNREAAGLQSKNTQLQGDIDLLLGDNDPSNDQSALQLQVQVQNNDGQIAQLQQLAQDQQQQVDELGQALAQLESRHAEMVNNYRRITMKEAAARSKDRAAQAAESAESVSGSIDAGSIDNIEAKIDHDNDVASARFDRVFGEMKDNASPEEAAQLARAKEALDARRAEIAAAAKQEPAPATT